MIKSKLLVGLLAAFSGFAAHATLLTFDDLANTYYGGTGSSNPALTGSPSFVKYVTQGYSLTLSAPNYTLGAHIGDGGGTQNFNWHDDGDNGIGAFVTLARVGGGTFNLQNFTYVSNLFTVSAAGYGTTPLSGTGLFNANFLNVSAVTFNSVNNINNTLDNMQVTAGVMAAVPEPETYAMLLAGLGIMGFVARRKSRRTKAG